MRIAHPLGRSRSRCLRCGYAWGMPASPIPVYPEPRPLAELLPPGAGGFAVVDLETSGTGQLCRSELCRGQQPTKHTYR